MGRFISTDSYISNGQGLLGNNVFTYCGNNTVNFDDRTGHFPRWLLEAHIAGTRVISRIQSLCINTQSRVLSALQAGVKLPRNLPRKGIPGSSQVLPNEDGSPKQKRWYGTDGEPVRDRDYNHPGDMEFPHDHLWENGKRGKEHLPPDPNYQFAGNKIVGIGIITIGGIAVIGILVNDSTGIGVSDDGALIPLIEWIREGVEMLSK
ncbi:MAG: hypothetical protein IJ744_01985 [Lachnospiraceae bacterium]|nr:hypothetical protein [Lachnospiraceae bacterium]